MTVVVAQYPDCLDNVIFINLKVGLNNLISETEISSADNPDVVNNKISYKIEIAKLTVELNKYFKMRNLEIPAFIIKWKSLCQDKNEFSEIRNIWEDAI